MRRSSTAESGIAWLRLHKQIHVAARKSAACDSLVAKDRSCFVLSFSSAEVHVHDIEMACHFPIAVWMKQAKTGSERQSNLVWEELIMDAYCLADGIGPMQMACGQQFVEGSPTYSKI